ncbi:DUF6520 family protein [Salinimicrobium sp. GXAS 041]|uniref:DUF6520 family protein n=1 Tax=Salinimicrobium sp. GXAS 041 TaxID=3400806 RepID=UPI003C70B214
MKNKFLIPAMAMFLAIGMSFATEKGQSDPSQDYYQQSNGVFMSLGQEINCGSGSKTCKVRLPNGQIYQVYDAPDPTTLKKGDGIVRQL